MILTFFAYLILIFALLGLLVYTGDRSLRSKGYDGPASDHFNGTVFLNIKDPTEKKEDHGFFSVLTWMLTREKNVWEKRDVQQTKPADRVEGKELVVTLINHATTLIQTNGMNILTDPIYSKRASPFSFAGPHRFTEPGVAFNDLPKIDIILISHNHYDHLDLATLARLVERDHPIIVVPLGNKQFLESKGLPSPIELDWWESRAIQETTITCVPAQHFSARSISDRNKTLWSGYVISTPHGNTYFAGDTGAGPFIDQIAAKFPGGFRLGLLPVGAFRPQWFMREVHISPDEAYAIQKQLKIDDAVAIHFGTFKLADDKQDEPPERIRELIACSTTPQRFHILANGEHLTLN